MLVNTIMMQACQRSNDQTHLTLAAPLPAEIGLGINSPDTTFSTPFVVQNGVQPGDAVVVRLWGFLQG